MIKDRGNYACSIYAFFLMVKYLRLERNYFATRATAAEDENLVTLCLWWPSTLHVITSCRVITCPYGCVLRHRTTLEPLLLSLLFPQHYILSMHALIPNPYSGREVLAYEIRRISVSQEG